jgi:formamidopyrimidine-DNA glycosylase
MPELPEVETIVRDLRPLLVRRRIASVKASRKRLRRRWSPKWADLLVGRHVNQVRRRGKWIVVDLDYDLHLCVHLGMTGQLRVLSSELPGDQHTHLVFSLDDGQESLSFRDIRRFGCAVLLNDAAELSQFFNDQDLGPEPFDLEKGYWLERLTATDRCLKAVLLDQRTVAGVGNIYADESLWEARLPPKQLGRQTDSKQAERLRKAIVKVLTYAIERRGSSIRNYVGGSGLKGSYQQEFRAYGRTGEPCLRCKTPIVQIRLAGRSTHFCPKCQQVEEDR